MLVSPPSKPEIGRVPDSGLLGRIDAFLEEAKVRKVKVGEKGEKAREAEREEKMELEEGYEGEHVALQLDCGVIDLMDDKAVAAAEVACRSGTVVGTEKREARSEKRGARRELVEEVSADG